MERADTSRLSRRPPVAVAALTLAIAASHPTAAAVTEPVPAGASTWSDPMTLLHERGSDPRITFDPAGNATASWLGASPDGPGLKFSRRSAGQKAWSAPVVADPRAASNDLGVRLVSTAAGRVTTLYRRHLAPRLWSVTAAPDGTLESPIRLSAAGTRVGAYDLAVDAAGTVTAAWVQVVPRKSRRVVYAQRRDGGAWSAPRFLSNDRYEAGYEVDVDAAPTGELLVGWKAHRKSRGGFLRLHTRTLVPGEGWSSRAVLTPADRHVGFFSVIAGQRGRARAAWNLFMPRSLDKGRVYLSSRRLSGAWTSPVAMWTGRNTESVGFIRGPRTIALTWQRPSEWSEEYYTRVDSYIRVLHTGSWSPTRRFSPHTSRKEIAFVPTMAFTPNRRMVLAWISVDFNGPGTYQLLVRSRAADGTWSPITTFTPQSPDDFGGADLAVDPTSGLASVVWEGQESSEMFFGQEQPPWP